MADKKKLSDNTMLLAEWDYSKNTSIGLDPTHLAEGSNKRAWWKCCTCQHEWEAQIQNVLYAVKVVPSVGEKNRHKSWQEIEWQMDVH